MNPNQALSNNSQTIEIQTYLDEQDFPADGDSTEHEDDAKIRDLFARVAIGASKSKPADKSWRLFSCFGAPHEDACEKYPHFTGAAKNIISLWLKKKLPVDFFQQAQKLLTIEEHKKRFIEKGLTPLIDEFIDFLATLEIDTHQDHVESIAGIFRVSAARSEIDSAMKSLILDMKLPDMLPRHDRVLLVGSLLKQCCRCLSSGDISLGLQVKITKSLFLIIKVMEKKEFKDPGKMDIRTLRIAAPAIFDLISTSQLFAQISEDEQKSEFGQFIAQMQSKSQSAIASSHFTMDGARMRLEALLKKEKGITSGVDMSPLAPVNVHE